MPAEMQDINLKHFILAFYFINSMPDASYCQDNTKEKKKKKKKETKNIVSLSGQLVTSP